MRQTSGATELRLGRRRRRGAAPGSVDRSERFKGRACPFSGLDEDQEGAAAALDVEGSEQCAQTKFWTI